MTHIHVQKVKVNMQLTNVFDSMLLDLDLLLHHRPDFIVHHVIQVRAVRCMARVCRTQ